MAQNTCVDCGKEYDQSKGWKSCPSCEVAVCPNCVENHVKDKQSERKQRTKIEKTKDISEYKDLICPSCGSELNAF
ncbi:MAG: hypothetical protein ACOC4G_04415 [Bacillota bacterium]